MEKDNTRAGAGTNDGFAGKLGVTTSIKTHRQGIGRPESASEQEVGVIGHLPGEGHGGIEHQTTTIDRRGTGIVTHTCAAQVKGTKSRLGETTVPLQGAGVVAGINREGLDWADADRAGAKQVTDGRVLLEIDTTRAVARTNDGFAGENGEATSVETRRQGIGRPEPAVEQQDGVVGDLAGQGHGLRERKDPLVDERVASPGTRDRAVHYQASRAVLGQITRAEIQGATDHGVTVAVDGQAFVGQTGHIVRRERGARVDVEGRSTTRAAEGDVTKGQGRNREEWVEVKALDDVQGVGADRQVAKLLGKGNRPGREGLDRDRRVGGNHDGIGADLADVADQGQVAAAQHDVAGTQGIDGLSPQDAGGDLHIPREAAIVPRKGQGAPRHLPKIARPDKVSGIVAFIDLKVLRSSDRNGARLGQIADPAIQGQIKRSASGTIADHGMAREVGDTRTGQGEDSGIGGGTKQIQRAVVRHLTGQKGVLHEVQGADGGDGSGTRIVGQTVHNQLTRTLLRETTGTQADATI